jgi:titin
MEAVNSWGASAWGTANVTTLPAAPVISSTGATYNSITLAWNAVPGATSYTVNYQNSSQVWTPTANQPTGAVTSFTIPGLTADTAYTYEVIANELVGSSTESSVASNALPVSTPLAVPVFGSNTADSTDVTLNWTPIADATSYVLERSTDNTTWTTITNTLNGSSGTFTDSGLASGTTYDYQLIAVDAAGSSPAATTSVLTAPAAPTLTIDSVSDNTLLLSWTASQGADAYVVKEATTTNGNTSFSTVTPGPTGTTTSLSVGSLNSDTSYTFEVLAHDSSGYSPASLQQSGTTLITAPTFTAAANTSSAVVLTFSANADATSYVVQRSDDGGILWTTVTQSLGPTSTTFTDTGVSPGTTYEYELEAVSAAGTSAPFGPVSVETAPDAPVLTGVPASSSEIDLTWTPVLSATGYTVKTNASGSWVAVATQPTGTATTLAVVNLSSGTAYSFEVIANNVINNSTTLSSVASQPATLSTLLGPPSSLTAGATTATSVVLNWTAVTGATSYVVQQSVDQSTWTTLSPGTPITTNTYTDTSVTAGNTYYYRVMASNSLGVSDPNTTVLTVLTPLNAPTGLAAVANSATQITLTWNQDTDAGLTGYLLQGASSSSGTWTTIASPLATDTNAVIGGLTTATTYYYRLIAVSAGGDSAPGQWVSATTN